MRKKKKAESKSNKEKDYRGSTRMNADEEKEDIKKEEGGRREEQRRGLKIEEVGLKK